MPTHRDPRFLQRLWSTTMCGPLSQPQRSERPRLPQREDGCPHADRPPKPGKKGAMGNKSTHPAGRGATEKVAACLHGFALLQGPETMEVTGAEGRRTRGQGERRDRAWRRMTSLMKSETPLRNKQAPSADSHYLCPTFGLFIGRNKQWKPARGWGGGRTDARAGYTDRDAVNGTVYCYTQPPSEPLDKYVNILPPRALEQKALS